MRLSAHLYSKEDLGGRVLKVNHAGEHGAVNIYAGQMIAARITAPSMLNEIAAFKSHEERHRATFDAELRRRGLPRCRSYALCGVGGFTLGLLTGLGGRRAIAATTLAVERVVLGHLYQQIEVLRNDDVDAAIVISSIVRDEKNHHDRSAAFVQVGSFWYDVLAPIVASTTKAVIWLGMHL